MAQAVHTRINSIKNESRNPGLTIKIPPRRFASSPVMIRRQSSITKDSTARKYTRCATCNDHIDVGERISTVKPQDAVAIASGILPAEVERLVASHVQDEITTIHHSSCAQTNGAFKTRSGRVSRKPVNIGDEKFIGGSGFSGCDTYDRSYDRGNFYDNESLHYQSNLTNFVVDDQEPVSPKQLESEDEGEWESGNDTSDEEMVESWD